MKLDKFVFGTPWLLDLLCEHWFASSVWNFCRWVADVHSRETSPSGEERGETVVFADYRARGIIVKYFLIGVCQWLHVALRHGAVSREHILCRRWPGRTFILCECLFIVCETIFYNRWITSNSPWKWHRTASTTSGWKSSRAKIFHRNSSGERRPKFIESGSKKTTEKNKEHRLGQRSQRCQHSDRKHVQRQRQNTITLQARQMNRGNTDFRRFKKRRGDQATLEV